MMLFFLLFVLHFFSMFFSLLFCLVLFSALLHILSVVLHAEIVKTSVIGPFSVLRLFCSFSFFSTIELS